MRFSFTKSKQKNLKKMSCITALIMSLLIVAPTNIQALEGDAGSPSSRGIQPVAFDGNNNQDSISGLISVKYDNLTTTPEVQKMNEGSLSDSDIQDIKDNLSISYKTITGSDTNAFCDWIIKDTSKFQVAYVDVKGANAYNRYNYANMQYDKDQGLHSPVNDANSKYPAISHVTFYLKVKPAPLRGSIEIKKLWDNQGAENQAPPGFILENKFVLLHNGSVVNAAKTVQENSMVFYDLVPEDYEVAELEAEGYTPKFKVLKNERWTEETQSKYGENGWKIPVSVSGSERVMVEVTNKKIMPPPARGTVTVNKKWVDFKGVEIPASDIPATSLRGLFTLSKKSSEPSTVQFNNEISVEASADNKSISFANLEYGTYVLTEKETAGYKPVFEIGNVEQAITQVQNAGYQLEICVDESHRDTIINVINKKDEPKGSITVSKVWRDYLGHEIGAPDIDLDKLISLYPVNGIMQEAQAGNGIQGNLSQDKKSLSFTNLGNGKYVLKESRYQDFIPQFKVNGTDAAVKACEDGGWQLELTVDGEHKDFSVQVTNTKAEPKGEIIVSKTWINYRGTPMSAPDTPLDEIFTLEKKDGSASSEGNNEPQIVINEENDIINFRNLDNGIYILKEKKLEGYSPAFKIGDETINAKQTSDGGWEIELSISRESKKITVDVTNRKAEPKASIAVKKTWKDSKGIDITGPGMALTDLFTLKDNKGNIVTGAVIKDGILVWEGLSLGTYTLEEKKIEGYETSMTIYGLTIKDNKLTRTLYADRQVMEINVTNKQQAVPVIAPVDPGTVPVDPGTPLPRTDKTFEAELLIIVFGILSLCAGVVSRFKRKDIK